MRKILLMMLIFIFIPTIGYAEEHELKHLNIHAYIHEDGSATITETRHANLSKGTENFIVIENIGKSEIKDFQVVEYGLTFEHVDEWDIEGSRADKVLKKSIIQTDDGYELVWGIGLYGEHEYAVRYTVTDFIKQLDDAQIIYWYFVSQDTNIPPQNVRIEIEAGEDLSFKDEKIWAYGFEGEIQFKHGKVIAKSEKPLKKSDYAVVLVKFDENAFATTDILAQSFSEIKKEADEGKKEKANFISGLFMLILLVGIVFTLRFLLGKFLTGIFRFIHKLKKIKKAPVKFAGQYVEQIPYDGAFYEVYPLLVDAKISNLDQLMAAYFLKWVKENRIKVEETERMGFIKSKKEVTIRILRYDPIDNEFERDIFSKVSLVADDDGLVGMKALQKSMTEQGQEIKQWEENVKKSSQERLHEKGYVKEIEKFRIGRFKLAYEKTEKGEELERDIFKFMNYLRDYSKVERLETEDTERLNEYIIWAALLGIAKETQTQLAFVYDGYPDIIFYPITIDMIGEISDMISYTSGAGGSFSGGGGGGAFGGGGGGTR